MVVGIDVNEASDKSKNGVAKLLHLTKSIDVIIYMKILKTKMQGAKPDDNNKHYKYLSNLIII